MFFAVLAAGQRAWTTGRSWGPPAAPAERDRAVPEPGDPAEGPLFSNADTGFLSELVTRLKPRLYGPGEYIVPYGEVGREMFFISRGVVEVCSEDGRVVFKCMADGEYFGEIALLYSDKRTASVRAKGYCDLFTLNREDLEAVLVDYPEVHAMLREVARSRMTGGHVPQKKPASAIMNGNTGSARSQIRRTSSVTAMGNSVGRGTLSRSSSFIRRTSSVTAMGNSVSRGTHSRSSIVRSPSTPRPARTERGQPRTCLRRGGRPRGAAGGVEARRAAARLAGRGGGAAGGSAAFLSGWRRGGRPRGSPGGAEARRAAARLAGRTDAGRAAARLREARRVAARRAGQSVPFPHSGWPAAWRAGQSVPFPHGFLIQVYA
eukprot:tig00000851_g4893.t1